MGQTSSKSPKKAIKPAAGSIEARLKARFGSHWQQKLGPSLCDFLCKRGHGSYIDSLPNRIPAHWPAIRDADWKTILTPKTQSKAAKRNPSADPLIQTLEAFHGKKAKADGQIAIPILEPDDKVAKIGNVVAIIYVSDRGGLTATYTHGFAENVFDGNEKLLSTLEKIQNQPGASLDGPGLYALPDHKTFLFQAKMTPRGIVG